MKLGPTISRLRSARGLKQKELAGRVGITPGYLSQIEHDRREPTLSLVKELASALGVPAPVVFFLALDEGDVPEEKRPAYRHLAAPVRALLEALFGPPETEAV